MNYNMLKEALRVFNGPLSDLHAKLMGENGEQWFAEFKKFIRKEKCWPEGKDSQRTNKVRKRDNSLVASLAILGAILLFFGVICIFLGISFADTLFIKVADLFFLFFSALFLFFLVTNVARVYGPVFKWKQWDWVEDTISFSAIYMFASPFMCGLFLAMLFDLTGMHNWDFHKPITDPQTWSILGWTTALYLVLSSIGYAWRIMKNYPGPEPSWE